MKPVQTFHVRPMLPERLRALEDLAYNLRWSWEHDTIALFRRLEPDLWESTQHNPVLMLGSISQERLQEMAQDEAFLAHLDRAAQDLQDYVARAGAWHRKTFGATERPDVAYFSMEFGITECLPIYSGGLGILAGDHLKSASELAVPLVGVGLLYQKGYFRQVLNPDGWQQERYPINDFSNMPVKPCRDAEGNPLRIALELDGQTALIRPWQAQVGRVTLILLDTNLPENPASVRDITDELYGGDGEIRILQEIVLGIGGIRALYALGLRARVYHMNEGHCAFLGLERIRVLMREQSLKFAEAREIVAASGVFTTHTPVPAGIDVFHPEQMERYFGPFRAELGLSREEFLDLGRVHPGRPGEPFSMAVLAIRTSGFANGVSRLHGRVSRAMWREVWPGVPMDEVPLTAVTNGVHPQTWISSEMRDLYDRYLGPRWTEEPGDTRVWTRSEQIPGEELWRTHERRRERLVGFARRRMVESLRRRGAGKAETAQAEELLDPEALTIGFARRFATYKRATLLLRDPQRLARILNGAGRPVQIIFAGKAHPRDDAGKMFVRQVVQLAREPEFRRHMVFLEDYDTIVGRYLVQGTDVWLNTPRRPLEASGTSGMKAAFNGALNLSIMDGWWDEAGSPRTGWCIGKGEEYEDLDDQDRLESAALYELLERDVVPLFYDRGTDGQPRGWIALMKSAISDLCPVFNTNRMVHEYTLAAYRPAMERRERLEADCARRARALAGWRGRVQRAWSDVHIVRVETALPPETRVGESVEVRAWIRTGGLTADDLVVQVYLGRTDENGEIASGSATPMTPEGEAGSDGLLLRARIPCLRSGTHGITVRVMPHHPDLGHPHETGLILWA
ncbi:MAG TPA: alpha-glucan family phosphorylase [Terriglobales bacterium]|nr:alpha-glucan family phosphorylase [Terriglobales bacterium]